MNITVCQFYTSNVPYGQYTESINKQYCDRNNYQYYVEKDQLKITSRLQGRAFTWYKPHLIKEVLEKFSNTDYVLFLDIDAIFCNEQRKIEEFITNDFSVLMTQDYGPSLVNAGVMLLKNDDYTKRFLDEWWDICETHPQYKQGLWHDQTCIGLWHQIQTETAKFKIIQYNDLNAREYHDSRFIFHAFSYGMLPNRTIDSIYYKKFNIKPTSAIKSLNELGEYHGTDKQYLHNYYNRFYQGLLTGYQDHCDILEIGILNGASLYVWKDFFNAGIIHGADINPLTIEEDRIKIFKLDQSSEESLREFKHKQFKYDVIIDDGSHKMVDQQITIQILFDLVKSGGYFIIEDLQTSVECRMPEKAIFGWGDPTKSTCLDMLYSIQQGNPITDFKTQEWESFISQIDSVTISSDRADSIYAIIKKKQNISNQSHNYSTMNNEHLTLSEISKKYPTDKDYVHNYYNAVYENYFSRIRNETVNVCEIGIGGFDGNNGWVPGNSLKVWRDYFPNAQILGLDIVKHNLTDSERITVDWLDQSKIELVKSYSEKLKDYDIIIDDGSHNTYDQIITLAYFFRSLKSGGIYILEDLHSSVEVYIPEKANLWGWGDPTRSKPLETLETFLQTKDIVNDYLTEEEIQYLKDNIHSVEIFKVAPTSITSVIIKK